MELEPCEIKMIVAVFDEIFRFIFLPALLITLVVLFIEGISDLFVYNNRNKKQ